MNNIVTEKEHIRIVMSDKFKDIWINIVGMTTF